MIKLHSLAVLLFVCAINAFGQENGYKNEFGFRSDNDAYLAFGQDHYYTNGIFITFRHAMDQSSLKGTLKKRIWELEAGQKMFTPGSAVIDNPAEIDRPFAGYSYVGGAVNLLYDSERSLKAGLQLGFLGPNSGAKEAQELLHNTFGFYEVSGWEYQIGNEFAANAALNFSGLLVRSVSSRTDLILDAYLNLGNTFTGAGAGLTFRAGKLNPLFHSAHTQSMVSSQDQTEKPKTNEIYFYARPIVRFVVYDATIQGPLFAREKGPVTFDIKPIVFTQQFGVSYTARVWSLDFNINLSSRDIQSNATAHQFGSISIFKRF